MTRRQKWIAAAGVLGLLLGALAIVAAVLLPSNEALRARAEAELRQRLGVEVAIGKLHWHALPRPSIVIEDAVTRQALPIKVNYLVAYPRIRELLHRRVVFESVEADGVVLPQASLGTLRTTRDAEILQTDSVPVEHVLLRNLTWITRRGLALGYELEATFLPRWRPREALLSRTGVQTPMRMRLLHKDAAAPSAGGQPVSEHWDTWIAAGGGTANGTLTLLTAESGAMRLTGELLPKNIEIGSAMASLKRHPFLSGKASGSTAVKGEGRTIGELVRSLHTATQFTLPQATMTRFDLDKALRSAGKDHEGQTPLTEVQGRMDTQNTAQGMVIDFTGVKAKAGNLTLSAEARLANRQIEAKAAVDIVDGVVGIPVRVSGPVAKPTVSVPPGSFAGAAIGTAILPGIGTAIGARIGAAVGGIFRREPASAPAAARP